MHMIVVIFKAKHTNVKPLTELQLHDKDSKKRTPASVCRVKHIVVMIRIIKNNAHEFA